MKTLLDTCIIIDILKNKPEAISFFRNLSEKPSTSILTISEIYSGIRNKKEEKAFIFLLEFIEVESFTLEISKYAGKLRKQYFPSHHTDLIDAIIAATAIEKGYTLKTLNTKHFPMIENLTKAY